MSWFSRKKRNVIPNMSNQYIRNENTSRKIKALPLFGGPKYEKFDPYNNENFRVEPTTGNYGSVNSEDMILPNNARNAIMLGPVKNGNNMVNFKNTNGNSAYESKFGRYYTKNTYNTYIKNKPHPFTRKPINTKSIKEYKAKFKNAWNPNRSMKNRKPFLLNEMKAANYINKKGAIDLTPIRTVLEKGTAEEKRDIRKLLNITIKVVEAKINNDTEELKRLKKLLKIRYFIALIPAELILLLTWLYSDAFIGVAASTTLFIYFIYRTYKYRIKTKNLGKSKKSLEDLLILLRSIEDPVILEQNPMFQTVEIEIVNEVENSANDAENS